MKRGLVLGWLLVASAAHAGECYEAAAKLYHPLEPDLLRAVAMTESGGKNDTVRVNRSKSGKITEDVCAMQINSEWFPKLARHGITRDHLLDDHCTCVFAGSWILAQEVASTGYTWRAVAQYHTGANRSRETEGVAYALKVLNNLERLKGRAIDANR